MRARAGRVIAVVVLCLAAAPFAQAQNGTFVYFPGTPPPRTHAPRPHVPETVQGDLRLSPLVTDDSPPIMATGPVEKGKAILRVGVRHRFTGALAADVAVKGWLAFGKKLPAGTTVYGIPMNGPDGPGVVWCAPKADGAKTESKSWTAICLPFGDTTHVWVAGHPAMFAMDLNWDDVSSRRADVPNVIRGPATFPAMTFGYVFGGWNASGWLIVQETIDWGEGPQLLRSTAIPPDRNGETRLKLMGGEISVRAAAAIVPGAAPTAVVSVLSPPVPGADLVL